MTAGIILAGSHVWRENALAALCPRALLPVANAPLITYTLAWLREANITRVVICANEDGHSLQAFLRDGQAAGLDLDYYEDRVPRGPAGCIRDAAHLAGAEQVVVVDGSIIPGVELRALLEWHARQQAAATVVVHRKAAASGDSEPWLDPVGIYVFTSRALEAVSATGFQDLKETLLPGLHRGSARVLTYASERPSPRVRGLASYLALQAAVLGRIGAGELHVEGYHWRNGTYLVPTARVSPGARVIGPVMIGPESVVEDGAIVIGPTVVGSQCVLKAGSVVTNSVLWDRSVIHERAGLGGCLVTTGVSLAAGAMRHGETCSNSSRVRACETHREEPRVEH